MKVEIFSDIVCPFCYIGKRRFEEALEQFNNKEKVEKVFRSFQLDPNAPKNPEENIHATLAKKYNMSYDEAKKMNNQVANQAREVGLHFDFDKAIHSNTLDAHRLSHYAFEEGKMYEFIERLMKAHFTDGHNVSDHQVLVTLAEEIGLSRDDSLQVLQDEAYINEVEQDISLAEQYGVQGVPFFVFNRKYAVSGAQATEVFLEVLEKVYEEEKENAVKKETKTEYCDGESCDA